MTPPRAVLAIVCAAAALLLSGCESGLTRVEMDPDAERAAGARGPLEQESINEIMLTVAGAEEAVAYFRQALSERPNDPELKRGLARSLARAGQHAEARLVWRDLVESGGARQSDRVEYALSLARLGLWDEAQAQYVQLPPEPMTARRLTLLALLADHREDWVAADAAYERARALSPDPAAVLNNWGVSHLARGDHEGAERRFEEALVYDPTLFSAKNNLALSYGLRGRWRLPLITLSGEEKAVLLHNLGVLALRQDRPDVARAMFERSIDAHPRHYPPAAEKLATLNRAAG